MERGTPEEQGEERGGGEGGRKGSREGSRTLSGGGKEKGRGRNQRNFETEIRATHSVLSVKQYSLHLPSSKKPLVVFQVDRRPVVQDEVQ